MTACTMLSSDSHVVEPPDLWRNASHHAFVSVLRVWYKKRMVTGGSSIGTAPIPFRGALVGKRFESPEELKPAARFVDVRPGAYLPEAHLKDNELDGVYGSVLYPQGSSSASHPAPRSWSVPDMLKHLARGQSFGNRSKKNGERGDHICEIIRRL